MASVYSEVAGKTLKRKPGRPKGSRKQKTEEEKIHHFNPMRWSMNQAALEFDMDKGAISKRLRALSLECGDDGKFSTAQICAAKYNDLELERARKVREDADGSALDNAKRRKELGEVRLFLHFLAEVGAAIKQHIVASSMTPEEMQDAQDELAILFNAKEITERICPGHD